MLTDYPVRHSFGGAKDKAFEELGGFDGAPLPAADRDQLARDIAEIERAAATLREAEPALETWHDALAPQMLGKPRPVWLLIGVLWVSTALVTLGAVVAISRLVG